MQKNFSLVWKNTLHNRKDRHETLSVFSTSAFLKKIIQYSNEIKDQKIVIKLDSQTIADPILLNNFAENIYILNSCGAHIIVVHDYLNLLTSSLQTLGISDNIILNLSSINPNNIQIVEMILSGYINKMIVSKLCEFGSYAIGISGKDGNLIEAKKLKSLHKRLEGDSVIDLSFISKPVVINPEILLNFEDMNIIPVISPIALDESRRTQVLDVNITASVISSAIGADHLVFRCNEDVMKEDGVKIYDINTIKNIKLNNQNYIEKNLFEAACSSIENSSNAVHFIDARKQDPLLLSFFPQI